MKYSGEETTQFNFSGIWGNLLTAFAPADFLGIIILLGRRLFTKRLNLFIWKKPWQQKGSPHQNVVMSDQTLIHFHMGDSKLLTAP